MVHSFVDTRRRRLYPLRQLELRAASIEGSGTSGGDPMSKNLLTWLYSFLILCLMPLATAGAAEQGPDQVTLGTITLSLNNLPIYVAQEKGFFAKENIFVEAVVLNASTLAIPVLIAGSTQLSASSAMTTIRAVEKGAALKIVGGLTNAPVYDLYAGPKYKSFKDLKGAAIGVSGLITSDTVIMKEMLKANGLEYPRDYTMRAM